MKSEKFFLPGLMAFTAVFSFSFNYFAVNPSLHYHYQQIAWYTGKVFLEYYLVFPGGPGEYLTLLVSQWFVSKVVGSLIVALLGLLISYFVYKTVYLKWGKLNLTVLLVPLVQVILLALFCDYRYPFSITVNLLVVTGFLWLCTAIDNKWRFVVSFQTIISGLFIYYISGGMFFLIFMASSAILLLNKPDLKTLLNVAVILGIAIVIPFVAYHFVFLTSLNSSFFRSTPDVAVMLRYGRPNIFYAGLATIPSILLLAKLTGLFQFKNNSSPETLREGIKSKNQKQEILTVNKINRYIITGLQLTLLFAISGFLLYRAYKPLEKRKIEIDYYAYTGNWEEVIAMSKKVEVYDRMVNFQFNRALLNTGQVLDKLFDYNQKLGSQGMFLDQPFSAEIALPNSDLYFDLGNIDESQRYAFESETLMRNSPRVLKRLILNCIIMDKMDAAHTYFNILEANPREKEWILKYRDYFSNPDRVESDPLIQKKRNEMNKLEGMVGTPPLKLLSQLDKNPFNKGVFEYLIALDLMDHDLTSFINDLKYIDGLNYKKIPVIIEEAVVLFRSQGKNYDELNRIRVSDSTLQRFREFAKLTSASKGDREKAKQATLAFSNTYWYYVLFLSPKVTNLKLETRPVDANY